MRFRGQSLTRLRLRYEGAVLRVYEMESGPRWVGYWTSRDVRFAGTPWRAIRWLVLRRPPRTYHPMVSENIAPAWAPPGAPPPPPGEGVREPRRPIRPTLSGAAELLLPDGE